MKTALVALTLFASTTLVTRDADAQLFGRCAFSNLDAPLAGMGMVILGGSGSLVMAAADVVYAARGQTMPPGWAISEAIHGVGLVIGGVVMVTTAQDTCRGTYDEGFGKASAIPFAVGAWFIGHAIYSLVAGGGGAESGSPSVREPGRPEAAWFPEIGVSPTDGGAFASLSWGL